MKQSRTHNCGELRLCNAGETVTIVGWLENVREVGNNFAFCVVRDYYGTTQVVVENEEMMKSLYDMGVDGMTVNFPDKLTEYIKSKQNEN